MALGQECPNIGFYMADMIVNKNDASALQAATADTIACMNLSGPAAASAGPIAQGAAQRMLSAGEQESHVSYEVLKDVIRRMSATPGQRIIVLASPGFWTTDSLRSDETDVMDRAIRNNITINGLDIRGLYVAPGFDASQRVNSIARATRDRSICALRGAGRRRYFGRNRLCHGRHIFPR